MSVGSAMEKAVNLSVGSIVGVYVGVCIGTKLGVEEEPNVGNVVDDLADMAEGDGVMDVKYDVMFGSVM